MPRERSQSVIDGIRRRTQKKGERKPARPPKSQARVFADVNLRRPPSYWDYKSFVPRFRPQGDYLMLRKIGRGKYSEVFDARQAHTGAPCIIKVLKPVRQEKIKREISILQALSGGVNIIDLLDLTMDPVSSTPCLVFEKVNNIDFRTLYPSFNDFDVRFYMYQLFKALQYAHSNGVMHRDVKPHNVMIDHKKRELRLIDWGLAEYYLPGQEYHVRVASLPYKGPELLVGLKDYDYSLDSWSAGAMFAGIIFRVYNSSSHFFAGQDRYDQLVKIAKIMGTEDLLAYINKYDTVLDYHYADTLRNFPKRPWSSFVTSRNQDLAHEDALDLLDHLLVYDHQKRFTAAETLAHPYFDPVRKYEASQQQQQQQQQDGEAEEAEQEDATMETEA